MGSIAKGKRRYCLFNFALIQLYVYFIIIILAYLSSSNGKKFSSVWLDVYKKLYSLKSLTYRSIYCNTFELNRMNIPLLAAGFKYLIKFKNSKIVTMTWWVRG